MKISIIDVWSDKNKGDSAIVLALIALLKEFFPNVEIYCHIVAVGTSDLRRCEYTDYGVLRLHCVRVWPSLLPHFRLQNIQLATRPLYLAFYLIRGALLALATILGGKRAAYLLRDRSEREAFKALASSEWVISKGGGFITNYSPGLKGFVRIFMNAYGLILAKLLKRRVVIAPQTIGPIHGRAARWLARWALQSAQAIFVREQHSKRFLENLGVRVPIYVVPDIAFYLSDPLEPSRKAQLAIGLDGQEPKIAVTVRRWIYSGHDAMQKHHKYLKTMTALLQYIAHTTNARLVLMPQALGPTLIEDDRKTMQEIAREFGPSDRLAIIESDYSPYELRYLYGCFDFIVGTRLHSIILAALSGVPALAIAYMGAKTHGTMEMLGMGEYVVDIAQMDLDALKRKFDDAWLKREALRAEILSRVARFRRELKDGWQRILVSNDKGPVDH